MKTIQYYLISLIGRLLYVIPIVIVVQLIKSRFRR